MLKVQDLEINVSQVDYQTTGADGELDGALNHVLQTDDGYSISIFHSNISTADKPKLPSILERMKLRLRIAYAALILLPTTVAHWKDGYVSQCDFNENKRAFRRELLSQSGCNLSHAQSETDWK